MTREEVIANVEAKIKRIKHIMDDGDYGCVDIENWEHWAKQLEYQEIILAALRGSQPDPVTGLVPCDYCNETHEQKPLFHENNYEPYTCMQSYIEIGESVDGKRPLICVDLWDGANACAAFEINYCPMCGRKLEEANENEDA